MKENKEHIIAKWIEGSVTDTELNTQFDADMSDDLKLIQDATADLAIPDLDSDALFQKIQADITPKSKNKSKVEANVSYLKYWVSGIAAILIGVLAYTAIIDQSIMINNDTLTYSMHTLPDGSSVHLNANSRIEYDKDFSTNRLLTLDGEAFFEVQKGEIFTVHTENGDITVLGTSFNVFSRSNNLTVACKTGKVKVVSDRENILGPGDKVVHIKNILTEKSVITADLIASWREGESIFKSSPLSEVIQALTSQYGYQLNGMPIDMSQRFTGSFIHNDIDKALRMVFLPMGISYKLDTQSKIIAIQ